MGMQKNESHSKASNQNLTKNIFYYLKSNKNEEGEVSQWRADNSNLMKNLFYLIKQK